MSTFVLLHGHYIGAWAWDGVKRRLEAAGHEVHAPALAGMGERFAELTPDTGVDLHVAEVTQLLVDEDLRSVVLVGHSYAGAVAGAAATRVPERIGRLVLLDAPLPIDGGRVFDQIADAEPALREAALDTGHGLVLPPPDPALAGVADPAQHRRCIERFTPVPLRTLDDRLEAPADVLARIPAAYVRCLRYPPSAAPAAEARGVSGWLYRELDAGHLPMLTHAAETASVLLEIAGASATAPSRGSPGFPSAR